MANDYHQTPTMVLSTSNPVRSGIIKSIEDSGLDHVHVRVDPLRYRRQVRIFHDLVKFKKLGVAYEDSIVGRSYAAVKMIENVAKPRQLNQVYEEAQKIAINLKTAETIGFDIHAAILAAADEIYREIED